MAGSTTEGQDLLGGCNNCSMDRCKCIDDAFNVPDASGTGAFGEVVERESYSAPAISRQISQEERRQHQVRAQSEQQQQHKNQQLPVKSEYEEMEIDFTEQFTSKRPAAAVTAAAPPPAPPPPPPPPPAPPQATSAQQRTEEYMFTTAAPSTLFETCGFCQDGTPCPCAEMAAEEQQQRQQLQLRNRQIALQDLEKAEPARLAVSSNRCVKSRMPTIQSLSHMTPPPSESDVFSEALPPISLLTRNTASSCGANGPGTCSQCQSDPRSTLFCKSLAAARALTAAKYSTNGHGTSTSTVPAPVSSPSGGCCGGGGRAGGGCCKDNQRDPTAAPPLTLSCADTFTTLSRHPQFLRATDEMDTWMPRLITLPNPAHLPGGTNSSGGVNIGDRPAMEVEAASVMNVLRYFDRRFSC
ncbi:hypothetical protein KEM54_000235 [Ascosphaera aggregata]|nr:hypothetical protein KEM54_000235 [Ascosphaera aggregata]